MIWNKKSLEKTFKKVLFNLVFQEKLPSHFINTKVAFLTLYSYTQIFYCL